MFIKIIIKVNIIKIYTKNTQQNLLQQNVALPESSSK